MASKKKPAPRKKAPAKKTPAKKTPGSKKGLAARVAADWGVVLPERLIRFFDQERPTYEGRSIFGMKGFGGSVKMPLRFAAGELSVYADYARSMTGIAPTASLPLAACGKHEGTYFVAVDLSKPELPVSFFDYESGFAPYAPDFEAFLKTGLLKKGEKTPTELLRGHYDKAKKLYGQKKYAAAEAILAKALVGVPVGPSKTFDDDMDLPGNAMNVLGCCREKLGRMDAAMKDFENATKMGSTVAGLNICSRFKDRGDWAGLITYGELLRERIYFGIAEYEWFWVRHYLGQAYLATGDVPQAVIAYHQIRTRFATSDAKKVAEAAGDLRELVKKKRPGAEAAAQILTWFDPPARVITDDRRQRLHAFWDRVPAEARPELLEAVEGGKPGKQRPSDEVLDRILRLEEVTIKHKQLGDVGFLKDFDRINDLNLEGSKFSGLGPIPSLTGLKELDLRNAGITSLKPLATLTRLRKLSCSENELESLDGVQSMTRLTYLHAPESGIRDLTPLAGLPELEELTVYNNEIDDVSPLASCPRLKEISCFGITEPFKGLPALAALPRLETVNGRGAPAADIQALRAARPDVEVDTGFNSVAARRVVYQKEDLERELEWWKDRAKLGAEWKKVLEKAYKDNADDENKVDNPSLQDLAKTLREDSVWVNKRRLKSLAPLTHFKAMDYLNASENELTDLSSLSGHEWLGTILVRENRLTSLAALSTLKRLEELYCEGNELESLAGLESVVTLRHLNADDNRIADASPLRGLVELRYLAICNNRLASLEPLSKLPKLETLHAYGNAVQDLSPLAGCPRLEKVTCFANPGLKGLLALKDLPDLRQVISHGALPSDEIREFARLRPDVEVD